MVVAVPIPLGIRCSVVPIGITTTRCPARTHRVWHGVKVVVVVRGEHFR